MKKTAIILLLLCLCCQSLVWGQKDSLKTSKWSFNLSWSRNYVYRIAHPTNEYYLYGGLIEGSRDINYDCPKYSWHAGFLISFKPIKRLSIQSGLIFDKQGFETNMVHDTLYGRTNNIISISGPCTYNFNFMDLGIPIKLMTELRLSKRFSCIFDIGFNYYFLNGGLRNIIGDERHKVSVGKNVNKNGNYSVNGGLGLKFSLKYIALSIKPNFNYFITQTKLPYRSQLLYYNLNLYSYGVELGLHINIDKRKNF